MASSIERYIIRTKYEDLLKDLHREMVEGRGDEEWADKLRDAMADLWHLLPPEDKGLVDQLSEALYMHAELSGKCHLLGGEGQAKAGVTGDGYVILNTRGIKKLELSNE